MRLRLFRSLSASKIKLLCLSRVTITFCSFGKAAVSGGMTGLSGIGGLGGSATSAFRTGAVIVTLEGSDTVTSSVTGTVSTFVILSVTLRNSILQ